MSLRIRLVVALALVASMTIPAAGVAALHQGGDEYHPIATEEFGEVWDRADLPVIETIASRTWIWGPGAFSELIDEPYAEAVDDTRQVQYFDKSRMEMPHSDADPDSPWFITQGLLATELMTGLLQLGDATFEQYLPAEIPVAGDPDDLTGPTYAAMGQFMDLGPRTTGEVITEVMDRGGAIVDNPDLATYGVTDAYFDEDTQHNIASVFWDFMNSTGVIWDGAEIVEDQPLFEDPFYAVGRPITEAYWARVTVDAVDQDVLIQCFERRCLTYTPGNPEGWEVESGNIGQHYYNWRYNIIPGQEQIEPTGGSFTWEGEDEVQVDVNDSVLLRVTVTGTGHGDDEVGLENVPVVFAIDEGEQFVTLETNTAVTGPGGFYDVIVIGASEGTAVIRATTDLDGTGTYTPDVDFELGFVTVVVTATN